MKKFPFLGWCLPALLGVAACGTARTSQPDSRYELTIESAQEFRLRGGEVVRIEPNGGNVRLVRRDYHQTQGNAFHVPYCEFDVSRGEERYFITDQHPPIDSLQVNGTTYQADKKTQFILIKFGEGVSIVSR